MSADEPAWGFAPPPFNVQDAMQRLRRELRELGLAEREGVFERRGQAIAKAVADAQAAAITAAVVRKPVRSSPEWQASALRSSADVRDFVVSLKRKLAQWSDSDE